VTEPSRTEAPVPSPTASDAGPVGVDLLCVALFVALGRTSHREGGAVTGYLATVWPFWVGALVGWAALVLLRRGGRELPGRSLPAGGVVLGGTVVAGMLLRRVAGGGTPVSFLLVATGFLAVFLLGWRAGVRLRRAR
jgi:Protein of unknown function (DUF3054)